MLEDESDCSDIESDDGTSIEQSRPDEPLEQKSQNKESLILSVAATSLSSESDVCESEGSPNEMDEAHLVNLRCGRGS